MSYRGYQVGDHVVMADPSDTTTTWKGVVSSVATRPGGGPKHCRVDWTGTNGDGSVWVDDMGMEFFEITLDPAFIDVPSDRTPETIERWLAS